MTDTALLPQGNVIKMHVPVRAMEPASTPVAKDGMTVLPLDQIQPYRNNPRRSDNPMYNEIRESIRTRGMDAPLSVTRRPGEAAYTLCTGGNTRLMILMELWHETRDKRFYMVPVMIRPWVSEANVLLGHMTENVMRGSMCFADTAVAVMDLKALIEKSEGTIPWKTFEQRLSDTGFKVSHTQLSRMRFLVDHHMNDLLDEAARVRIGPHHVQKLMTAFNNSNALTSENEDIFARIISRHGIDIDGAIEEIAGHARSATANVPTTVCEESADSSDKSSPQSNSESADGSPAHLLQVLLNLRHCNYQIIMGLPCDGFFEDAKEGIGFRRKKYKRLAVNSLASLMAGLCARQNLAISLDVFFSLDDASAAAVQRIMSNVRQMRLASSGCIALGMDDPLAKTNQEIMQIKDELSPASAVERRLLLEYVKRGATSVMIISLFPAVTMTHLREMRTSMGLPSQGGRPPAAFPSEDCHIWTLWKKSQEIEEKKRFLIISKKTGVPLGTVWNVIKGRIYPKVEEAI